MAALPPISTSARFEPALGCKDCFARDKCGGLYAAGMMDCLAYCCGEPANCTYLCPKNERFLAVWRDTGGIEMKCSSLPQSAEPLPLYVPLLQHGSRRQGSLRIPMAALTTFEVTKRDETTRDMCRDAVALRTKFKLHADTPLILSSISPDRRLEHYWRMRKYRRLIDGIKSIQPQHIIAPNFSLFRDIPRFDNLANIRRSLVCAEEFSQAGLSVIPYVAGVTEQDWRNWAAFLREHPEVVMVCKEFQTGPSTRVKAEWHIERLKELQQATGRALHLVAVGGRRVLSSLQPFKHVTVIDSVPFMRTMHRRRLAAAANWPMTQTEPNEPLDDLLEENITAYAARVEAMFRGGAVPPRRPKPVAAPIDTNQFAFVFQEAGDRTTAVASDLIPIQETLICDHAFPDHGR